MLKIKKENKKNITLSIAILICLFFACLNPLQVQGDDDIDELEEKRETYRKIIDLKQKQQIKIDDQIETLDNEINYVENSIGQANRKVEDLNLQIEDLIKKIRKKEETIEAQKEILSQLIRVYYEFHEQDIFSVILTKAGLSGFMKDKDKISQVGDKIEKIMADLKALKLSLENQRRSLENKKEEVIKTKEELEERNYYLEITKSEKRNLLVQAKNDEKKYRNLLEVVDNEIYRIEASKTVDLSEIPPAKGDYFDYPVANVRITQEYGMTSFAKSGAYNGKAHNGIDFGINYNNVFAAKEGRVIQVGNNGKYAYGKWIAIDHGDGLITLYGHLNKKKASKGEKVKKGEIIGESGNTGYSTGPHLHFSVFSKKSFELIESKYVDGLYIPTGASVNPMMYLK